MKKTPLFSTHRRAGAKMVEFAGWAMPVQYRGVIEEHLAVRSHAGLFDVSHMGEIEVCGSGAAEFCQYLTANDVSRMRVFQAQYNLLLNERGGVLDDVIFYRVAADKYFICVNASNSDADFAWVESHARGRVAVANVSAEYAQLALQGPRAEKILSLLAGPRWDHLESFAFQFADVAGIRCLVSRTGYTGEDGFELYCRSDRGTELWSAVLDAGIGEGLVPAGLGARDTLRLEMAYPLYGHELDESTTPLEAGLGWVTKLSKGDFLGRADLLRQKELGVARRLVGLEMLEPGIARGGHRLFKNGVPVGRITSGTKSPSLGKAIALAYVDAPEARLDNFIDVEIRGRNVPAKVVSTPFYRRQGRKEA